MVDDTPALLPPRITTQRLPEGCRTTRHADAVFAFRVEPIGHPHPGLLLPSDVVMLTVNLPHPSQARARPASAWLWPMHVNTGAWRTCADGCVTLAAALRPDAALALLRHHRFGDLAPNLSDSTPTGRVSLSALVGHRAAGALERAVESAPDVHSGLQALVRWVDEEAVGWPRLGTTLQRLGGALSALRTHTSLPVAEVAERAGVHRRWFERESARWFGVSPKQIQMAARFQQAMRLAWRGIPAAQIAADLALADQSHLSRSLKHLSGLTLTQLRRSDRTPVALAYRQASGGGHVFA